MTKFSKVVGMLGVTTALILGTLSTPSYALESFAQAKKVLPKIYATLEKQSSELGNTSTLYCSCPIDYTFSKKKVRWTVDLKSCGYQVRKNANRAQRIEVEHVMPAWEFGHQLKCWQNGGRKNCESDTNFAKMEGDLHNLFPSVGEVNGDRANFQFTDWNGQPNQYGQCAIIVDFKNRQVQPPQHARGIIARTYLYMAEQYNIRLAPQQRKLYEAWNKLFPAKPQECERNRLITKEEGHDNPFVTASCKL